jgi:hypothetical protein
MNAMASSVSVSARVAGRRFTPGFAKAGPEARKSAVKLSSFSVSWLPVGRGAQRDRCTFLAGRGRWRFGVGPRRRAGAATATWAVRRSLPCTTGAPGLLRGGPLAPRSRRAARGGFTRLLTRVHAEDGARGVRVARTLVRGGCRRRCGCRVPPTRQGLGGVVDVAIVSGRGEVGGRWKVADVKGGVAVFVFGARFLCGCCGCFLICFDYRIYSRRSLFVGLSFLFV